MSLRVQKVFVSWIFSWIVITSCVKGQNILRNCNDPLILTHTNNNLTFSHTYCFHSCGYLFLPQPVAGFSTCTPAGNCICSLPCGSAPPTIPFGDDICPMSIYYNDIVDPDTTAMQRCNDGCALECPQGTGQICGETQILPGNTFSKICTCYCPPQVCVTPTPVTTTTTTVATTTTTAGTVVILLKNPLPLLKKKSFNWKILKKIFKLCLLTLKLCLLYWIKCFLIILYVCLLNPWIYSEDWWDIFNVVR